jgi:hypothetical protein
MDQGVKAEADRRFEEARTAAGARDPRDFYRQALRGLKGSDPDSYERAVRHFESVLMPSIASGEAEPLKAWREYGKLIAELIDAGRTVEIDDSGRARPYTAESPMDRLVLHLPDRRGGRAILVSLPPRPTSAQRAAYELLVRGKQRLPES